MYNDFCYQEDPCEYADKPGRSRYRSLEETIVSLQSRVNELEDENVQLHGTLDSQSVGIDSKTVLPLRRVTQLETPDASEHSGSPPTKLEEESSAFTLLEGTDTPLIYSHGHALSIFSRSIPDCASFT